MYSSTNGGRGPPEVGENSSSLLVLKKGLELEVWLAAGAIQHWRLLELGF